MRKALCEGADDIACEVTCCRYAAVPRGDFSYASDDEIGSYHRDFSPDVRYCDHGCWSKSRVRFEGWDWYVATPDTVWPDA